MKRIENCFHQSYHNNNSNWLQRLRMGYIYIINYYYDYNTRLYPRENRRLFDKQTLRTRGHKLF